MTAETISTTDLRKVDRLRRLSYLLDNSIQLPVVNYRVGFDALIGLIPGIGDLAGLVLSAYIILQAAQLDLPKRTLLLMVFNVTVEALVGAIPVLGDLFDFTWKANLRNIALLEEQLGIPEKRTYPFDFGLAALILALLTTVSGGIAALVYGVARLWGRLRR